MNLHPEHFWLLDPSLTHLNHGSFGACPRPVLEEQQRIRTQMESCGDLFFRHHSEELLDHARSGLASFLHTRSENIAFIPNTTTGVNTVLRSLNLRPTDHVLTTSHEYNACKNALLEVSERSGASITVLDLPFPVASCDDILERIVDALQPNTRIFLFDHITSPTALVFPAERIVSELERRGIDTLVDGAHAPGMLDLHLDALGATYYVGNCHKWLCAPKGSAFLYVRPDRQNTIRPPNISHGKNSTRTDRSRFHLEFDWTGTMDISAYLSVPTAIQALEQLNPAGWNGLRSHFRQKTIEARRLLCQEFSLSEPCPESMIGSMASIVLPDAKAPWNQSPISPISDQLLNSFQIVGLVFFFPAYPHQVLRISMHHYNDMNDIYQLINALKQLLA